MRRAAFWKGRWHELTDYLDEPGVPPIARPCALFELSERGFPVEQEVLEAALVLGEADTTLASGAFCKAMYAADRGRWADHARVVAIVRRDAETALAKGDSLEARRAQTGVQFLEGYVLWKRGRRDEALRILRAVQPEAGGPVNGSLAKLLVEMGRPEEAEPYLRSLRDEPLAQYRLAKIYEEREDWDAAREAYEYFATYWRDADPEIQPLVVDARQAAIRLQGLQRE